MGYYIDDREINSNLFQGINSELIQDFSSRFLWAYLTRSIGHPVTIAKLLLQVHYRSNEIVPVRDKATDEIQNYEIDRLGYAHESNNVVPPWELDMTGASVRGVLYSLVDKEGFGGLFKGNFTSFTHQIFMDTTNYFLCGIGSALLAIPDPTNVYVAESIFPLSTLALEVAAATLAAIIASPLDVLATSIIITPKNDPSVSTTWDFVRGLSGMGISRLIFPTGARTFISTLFNKGTPYFTQTLLGVDPVEDAMLAVGFIGLSQVVKKLIVLPIETALRRGQVYYSRPHRTIVRAGTYCGLYGTIASISSQESMYEFDGLYRGWKISAFEILKDIGTTLLELVEDDTTESEF